MHFGRSDSARTMMPCTRIKCPVKLFHIDNNQSAERRSHHLTKALKVAVQVWELITICVFTAVNW